jgi:Flp pilus assembly protein TadB
MNLETLSANKKYWENWFLKGNCSLISLAYLVLILAPPTVWALVVYLGLMGVVVFIGRKYKKAQDDYRQAFDEKTQQERIDELRKGLRS